MMNGLSLFSGYAGIDVGLREYVRPILYCEIEPYAQAILLSRMDDGSIPYAPVWSDVRTLGGAQLKGLVDVVYGGFPCQDISVAGNGKGLDGERSGLFSEIIRLCEEASPAFIFLENVPAIRTRGADVVQSELARIGYDSRWTTLSAAEVGANHKRERWFCLAHANSVRKLSEQERNEGARNKSERVFNAAYADGCALRDESGRGIRKNRESETLPGYYGQKEFMAHPDQARREGWAPIGDVPEHSPFKKFAHGSEWWATEPDVGRVVNGLTYRVDRVKACGNGVVPLQVQTAWKILMGIAR
jgi:DNA (cytosine-5)-methyltransferase 1